MMIRRNLAVCLGFAVVLAGLAFFRITHAADNAARAPLDANSRQLLERIKQVESRVAQLEQRGPAPLITLPVPQQSNTVVPSVPPSLPGGATPREFNGMRYYIVPLDKAIK